MWRGDSSWPGRDLEHIPEARKKLDSVAITARIAAAAPRASVGPVVLFGGNGASSCSVEREIIPIPGELGPSWSAAAAAAKHRPHSRCSRGKNKSAWSGRWDCLGLTGVLGGAAKSQV